MDHDNGLTYKLTYCLSYIIDHDKVLPTIIVGKTVVMIQNVTQTIC
jgi:hypothetical protein